MTAEGVFGPEVDLPSSYAVHGDPDTELYLQFPTTLSIEDRVDGTYYHFRRVYPARRWANIEALKELLLDEPTKRLKDKKEHELTRADRVRLVKSYTDFEAAKLLTFARAAYLATTPDAPQDDWLALLAEFDHLLEDLDLDAIATVLEIEDEHERDEALAAETRAWEATTFKTLQEGLRTICGYGGRQMKTFMYRYEAQRKGYEITRGLGDDVFQITVVMPGRIVGSNADGAAGDRATWKFSGRRFRDRDLELLVSSRLDLF